MEERTQFGAISCVRLGLQCVGTGGTAGFPVGGGGEGAAGSLQAAEDFVGGHESCSKKHPLGAVGTYGVVFPKVGFGAEEAAQGPLVSDKGVDLEALLGRDSASRPDWSAFWEGTVLPPLPDGRGSVTHCVGIGFLKPTVAAGRRRN